MKRNRKKICCVLSSYLLASSGFALNRPMDPVVLAGSDLAKFIGVAPSNMVAFSYSYEWSQIPVQVDERVQVSFRQVYNNVYNLPTSVTFLAYADTNTFTGADTNALFDADDELAFMAFDAGERAPENATLPTGVVSGSGVELMLSDPLDGSTGTVYLFETDGSLSPAAGRNYVDYHFVLNSGNYKATYNLTGQGYSGTTPNPEASVVTSPCYRTEFSERWIRETEQIFVGGADGTDYLDRHLAGLPNYVAERNEETFTMGEGAFIANINGAVRGIRSYLGSNSGPATERTHLFYKQRQDVRTYLRVHAGITGPRDTYNYATNATGMTYYNEFNTNGVAIDGSEESIDLSIPAWEMVAGPHGTLLFSHSVDTDIPNFSNINFYSDDSFQTVPRNNFSRRFGWHGPWINMSELPNTDPLIAAGTGTPNNQLNFVRAIVYLGTNVHVAAAAQFSAGVETPIQVEATAFLGDSDSDGMADAWEIAHFSNLTPHAEEDADLPRPDGMSNLEEYIAGTNPTNSASYFHATVEANPSQNIIINWQSVSGRVYNMLWTPSLMEPFQPLEIGIQYPKNSYTDTVHSVESSGYYRVLVMRADYDIDGDGLPNDWETRYAVADAYVDGDGDGFDNLSEFIAGTDPTNGASFFRASSMLKEVNGTNCFAVEWISIPDRLYSVQWSTNLINGFTTLNDHLEYPINSYTDTLHAAESKGFYKIDVRMKR